MELPVPKTAIYLTHGICRDHDQKIRPVTGAFAIQLRVLFH